MKNDLELLEQDIEMSMRDSKETSSHGEKTSKVLECVSCDKSINVFESHFH